MAKKAVKKTPAQKKSSRKIAGIRAAKTKAIAKASIAIQNAYSKKKVVKKAPAKKVAKKVVNKAAKKPVHTIKIEEFALTNAKTHSIIFYNKADEDMFISLVEDFGASSFEGDFFLDTIILDDIVNGRIEQTEISDEVYNFCNRLLDKKGKQLGNYLVLQK